MVGGLSIEAFCESAQGLSEAELSKRYPDPFFLVELFAEVAGEETGTRQIDPDQRRNAFVIAVRKREGANPFGRMVTIGRHSCNDVLIPAGDVSRVHAYVIAHEGGGYAIRDAGSTCGTSLDGVDLESRQSVPLPYGSVVGLASVRMTFLRAPDLLRLATLDKTPAQGNPAA